MAVGADGSGAVPLRPRATDSDWAAPIFPSANHHIRVTHRPECNGPTLNVLLWRVERAHRPEVDRTRVILLKVKTMEMYIC